MSNWHSADSYEVAGFPRFRLTSALGVCGKVTVGDLRFHVLLSLPVTKVATHIDSLTTVCTRESPIAVLGSVQRCWDINMVVVVVVDCSYFLLFPTKRLRSGLRSIPRRLLLVCPS